MTELRFSFGNNWQSFAKNALTLERVTQARADFAELYRGIPLAGKSFLDVGFGQGLTLCLAAESGAAVLGLDIDANNREALAATALFLSRPSVPEFKIGSILDAQVVAELGSAGGYDIVHAWGSLHHTGDLAAALQHAAALVKPGGHLVVAIYNDHWSSPIWKIIKYCYNRGGPATKSLLLTIFYPLLFLATWMITGNHPRTSRRGMDFKHDVIDWIGGYPYEFWSAARVIEFTTKRGLTLVRTIPAQVPTGNNELVFCR